MTDFATARTHMIDGQLRPNEVNDERVLDAIRSVPREHFVPKAKRAVAYVDEDLDLGGGRFLMEPMIFAKLIVAADIRAGDLILDIGCASGYSSAVLAHLGDAVVALEEETELAGLAEKKLAELEVMNAAVVTGTLTAGVAKQGPYDVIFIEGAVEQVPPALIRQLKDGGRLVCVHREYGPVARGHLITMEAGVAAPQDLFDANVPVLPGFTKEQGFVF